MARRSPTTRAERTARSREAIIDAALELFARDGYDDTTTEQIAELAGVSPRTFFRYFQTKESVVFYRDYGFMRSFSGVYLAQPSWMSDYDALRAALVSLTAGFDEFRERITRYRAAVDSSAVLLGRERRSHQEHADTISLAIAARRGGDTHDDASRTLAAIGLTLYQRALARWLAGPPARDLAALVDGEFVLLGELTGQAMSNL